MELTACFLLSFLILYLLSSFTSLPTYPPTHTSTHPLMALAICENRPCWYHLFTQFLYLYTSSSPFRSLCQTSRLRSCLLHGKFVVVCTCLVRLVWPGASPIGSFEWHMHVPWNTPSAVRDVGRLCKPYVTEVFIVPRRPIHEFVMRPATNSIPHV